MKKALDRVAWDLAHEVAVNVLAAFALGVLAFVLLGGSVQDLYLRMRVSAPTSGEVALLTLDEEAFYLWDAAAPAPDVTPRALLAELIQFLDAAGARVIVLDLLLDSPQPGDDALAAAAKAHGAVVAAERFHIGSGGSVTAFAPATVAPLDEAVVAGFANLEQEESTLFSEEMLVRRAPLVWHLSRARLTGTWPMNLVGGWQDDHTVMPSLTLAAAWLKRHPGASSTELYAALETRCGGLPLACTISLADLGLPVAPGALTDPLSINFRGRDGRDGIPVVPAARVLRLAGQAALARTLGVDMAVEVPEEVGALLRDKVVVIGRVDRAGEADRDHFVTPFSFPTMLHADMAGCRIQAQVIDTLLSGRHIRAFGGWPCWLVGLGLAAAVVASARGNDPARHTTGWLLVATSLLAGGVMLFSMTDGVSVDVAPPLAGLLTALTCVHVVGRAKNPG